MDARIVIVGAGPAGALLAYLLSSRKIDTLLIERQTDFSREFRGEVLMPSGVRALEEAGIDLAAVSTVRPAFLEAYLQGRRIFELDARELEGPTPIAVSQPELLEHLVARAQQTGHFQLLRGATVRGIQQRDGTISLRIKTTGEDREQTLHSSFLVGADGRGSIVRKRLAPQVRRRSAPLDVVWFKLPLPVAWKQPRFRFEIGGGHLLISLQAPDGLLQVAWVILKGTYGDLRQRGIEEWALEMAAHADPELSEHITAHCDAISLPFLLDVVTDRVLGWASPGALLIGDAAHTMSPVGAQGLNLALRDAIVTANQLVPAWRKGADLNLAASRVEILRGPEIDRVQRFAALPPRIIMGRSIFHTGLRRALTRLVGIPAIRKRAATSLIVSTFLEGSETVRLEV